MPFDPTLPMVDAPLDAAVVCAQLNALKALIDALSGVVGAQASQLAALGTQVADLQTQLAATTAGPVNSIDPLDSSATPADVVDKINEMLARLQRQ